MSAAMDTDTSNKENIVNTLSNVRTSIRSKKKITKEYTGLPNTIVHDRYPLSRKKVFVREDTALYYCKHHHIPCKCKARVKIQIPSGSV